MEKINQHKPIIIKAVEYHYPHAKIYLFGSWATGQNRPNSDIDLALDIGEPIDLHELDRIKRTIDNLDIPRKIDVVDIHGVSEDFKRMILKERIAWKE
jgi:predicted nucleotidyltransferase